VGTDSGDAEPVVGPNKCLDSYAAMLSQMFFPMKFIFMHGSWMLVDILEISWMFMDFWYFSSEVRVGEDGVRSSAWLLMPSKLQLLRAYDPYSWREIADLWSIIEYVVCV